MTDPIVDRIQRDPQYLALRKKRNRLGVGLTLLVLLVYYGYIVLIAFDKPFLAQPVGAGVTSLGIPIGMAVIAFTIVINQRPIADPWSFGRSLPSNMNLWRCAGELAAP